MSWPFTSPSSLCEPAFCGFCNEGIMVAVKDEVGRAGEQAAADYLHRLGYRILERNWRCRQGEIDIVAVSGRYTVFAEVKSRSNRRFGHPFEAITTAKLSRLRRLAIAWCETHPAQAGRRIRIDAIAVIGALGSEPTIEHLEGVF